MPSERSPAARDEIPEYPEARARIGENPARYICADLDPAPRVRGIQSLRTIAEWERVAGDLGARRTLQLVAERRAELEGEPVDDEPEPLQESEDVVDAGADHAAPEGEPDQEPEPEAHPEPTPEPADVPELPYDSRDDPEFESKRREAAGIAKSFGLQQCEQRLQEEHGRDPTRPHVVDALEARIEQLREELPDDGDATEVTA